MYVAQMKAKLLISIGRWGKLMLDLQVVRQVVRQINETFQFNELSGRLDARQVTWIFPSATKKEDPSVALGTPSVTLKISPKWWISSEQGIQLRIPTIPGKLFSYYIHICLKQSKSSNEEILL